MENAVKLIHEFFKKSMMKYDYIEEKKLFLSGIKMEGVIGNLRLFIPVSEDSYLVYATLNGTPESEFYGNVAEYLHRANYGLRNGNFEFDYTDGEIRYKTFVNFEGIQLTMDVVADSILLPILMFEQYGKNLLQVMMGNGNPAELVREAEESYIQHSEDTSLE